MIKVLLFLFTTSVFANTIIINPHFGHTLHSELNSNLFSENNIKASGLTRGLKILYRHTILFYGVDYEASDLRVRDVEDTDGYSSERLSFLVGMKLDKNDYYGKITTFGNARIDGVGDFAEPLGFEVGYSRRIVVEGVTKLMLYATYSRITWEDFSNNSKDTDYNLTIKKLNIGVSIPFEIDL
jgi:hypothetical protein